MKKEALKLADELDGNISIYRESADMIRRLVEELDKQKPLSETEISLIFWAIPRKPQDVDLQLDFARAIEERHGIK